MAKRRATTQITKENCEEEDECEEDSGEFQKADRTEIANRQIKTARRRSGNVSSPLPSFAGFGSTSTTNSPFAFLNKPLVSTPTTTTTTEPKDESTKADKLKSLNLCFLKWIQQHLDKNPYVVLTPVFKDYENHFQAISSESAVVEKPAVAGTAQPVKTDPPAFNFFTSTSTTSTARVGAGLFSFSSNDSKLDVVKETVQPKPSFSFNLNSEAPKTSGFTFGMNSNTSAFNSKPEETKATNGNDENNEGEPSDEPPKFDFVPPGEEGSTFEMRCKVFLKKDGQFASIGVGTLFLKPVTGGKTQLITRADTSQGSVLLNLILTPDLPLQKTGKNNVLMVCVPTPDAEPPPVPVLIRVKSEEERDRLLSEMTRLQAS